MAMLKQKMFIFMVPLVYIHGQFLSCVHLFLFASFDIQYSFINALVDYLPLLLLLDLWLLITHILCSAPQTLSLLLLDSVVHHLLHFNPGLPISSIVHTIP